MLQPVSPVDLPDQAMSRATTSQAQTLCQQAKATELINNFIHPPSEEALVLLFQSPMVVTTHRVILSKIIAVGMASNFTSKDTTSQLTVKCDRQWGVTKVGSLRGLPMARVMECPGVELVCIHLRRAGYRHRFGEKITGAYSSVDPEECLSFAGINYLYWQSQSCDASAFDLFIFPVMLLRLGPPL